MPWAWSRPNVPKRLMTPTAVIVVGALLNPPQGGFLLSVLAKRLHE
jgi:hypothetical protein